MFPLKFLQLKHFLFFHLFLKPENIWSWRPVSLFTFLLWFCFSSSYTVIMQDSLLIVNSFPFLHNFVCDSKLFYIYVHQSLISNFNWFNSAFFLFIALSIISVKNHELPEHTFEIFEPIILGSYDFSTSSCIDCFLYRNCFSSNFFSNNYLNQRIVIYFLFFLILLLMVTFYFYCLVHVAV